MNAVKSIYMPIRRYFFLEDDEEFHPTDTAWMIVTVGIAVISLTVCIISTFGN